MAPPREIQTPRLARLLRWIARHRLVLVITLIALAVRLAWNLWIHPPWDYVFSDMAGYVARADRLVDAPFKKRADEAFFPYGTHYLLAAVKAVFGKQNHAATAIYQALLGAAIVAMMVAMSRRLSRGHRWVPRLVGLLGAFYYPLISFGGYYLSEPPYAFFLTAAAFFTLRLADTGRRRDAWLLGLAIGLGAAVRPQILMVVPCLGLFWLLRRRALRPVHAGQMVRAAIPIAAILALSAAFTHYHTGRVSLIAQNGAVNRVFGRCHNIKTTARGSWFGPPSLGALHKYSKRRPDALLQLDPAMGLELKTGGRMWDEDRLHVLADRCIKKTGWLRQARYAVTHVVLLWGYNNTWPDASQRQWRRPMHAWTVAHTVAILPPLVIAAGVGFRRHFARHGLLAMYLAALLAVSILYFGDTRYRVPYDAIFIVLALDVYGRLGRMVLRLLMRIPR